MVSVVGVIPARGGSKSIPRKNIRGFLGKPLLAWMIEVARESGVFDRLVLSTDDPAIAETGRRLGAEVPSRRPFHLREVVELMLSTGATHGLSQVGKGGQRRV